MEVMVDGLPPSFRSVPLMKYDRGAFMRCTDAGPMRLTCIRQEIRRVGFPKAERGVTLRPGDLGGQANTPGRIDCAAGARTRARKHGVAGRFRSSEGGGVKQCERLEAATVTEVSGRGESEESERQTVASEGR